MATPMVAAELPWAGREIVVLGVHTLPPVGAAYAADQAQALAETMALIKAEAKPVAIPRLRAR
jgi:hypothetical protein